jgi:hypothetical protein
LVCGGVPSRPDPALRYGKRGCGLPDLAGADHDLDERRGAGQPIQDSRYDVSFDLHI